MKPKKKRPQRRGINKKTAFLAAYRICADLTASAAACGINRSMHYVWLAEPNGKYKAAFEAAKVQAVQSLLDSAVHRAMVGVYEPLVYQGDFTWPMEEYIITPAVAAVEGRDWKDEGGPVEAVEAVAEVRGHRRIPGALPLGVYKRSEMLHAQLLRAWIPEFRTTTTEVTGAAGGPIENALTVTFVKARDGRPAE